jgi:hypothetical protein
VRFSEALVGKGLSAISYFSVIELIGLAGSRAFIPP